MGKSKVNITNWPCHAWSQIKNKKWWPTNKLALGVCYRLLCTHLGDRISCTSTPNHNIHGENGVYQRWTICAVKSKSVSEMPFPAIWRPKFQKNSPWCPTDSTKSKETQSLGKNSCREKCLDKSLLTLSLEIFGTFIVPPGRKLRPKGNIVSTVMIFNGVR